MKLLAVRDPQDTESPDNSISSVGLLAAIYFIVAKLALTLAQVHPSVTPVWPCSGIALAALLLRGNSVWPGIFIGAFAANLVTSGSISTSLAIAVGHTAEGLVGAWLVRRFAGGLDVLERTRDFLKFAFLGGLLSTTISATVGVTSLALAGLAAWNDYDSIWMTWWLGNATGMILVMPLLLLWCSKPRFRSGRTLELVFLIAGLTVVGELVFNLDLVPGRRYPLEYVCFPFLVWAAFRFGRRGTVVTALALAVTAMWGTLHQRGPFTGVPPNEALLLLQSFLSVCSIMSLALAVEVRQRRRSEKEARSLAVSDPLTGVGNYRRLVDALEAEIQRAERIERAFAFVLLDLDELKKINDVHGHLVGTRALCRIADVLRVNSRRIDTIARYGGDEFAVILPETESEGGRRFADRIVSRLAEDREKPPITISFGVATWPHDARTTESLFRAADRALYEMKRRRRGSAPAQV
jgi:diguanylate cyclase (GGDEF)-like protein